MVTLKGNDPFDDDAAKKQAHRNNARHKDNVERALRERLKTASELDACLEYLELVLECLHRVDGVFDEQAQAWRKFLGKPVEAIVA